MSSFPKALILFFSSAALFFAASCSNDEPEVSGAVCNLVYDFKDDESMPEVKLSVFVSVESDVRHVSFVKIVHEESGLEWNCNSEDAYKVASGGIDWVGSTNFVPERGKVFPQGVYGVIYEDLAERDFEVSFKLHYPEELQNLKAVDFPLALKVPSSRKIAVYSNEDELLYFGDEKPEWNLPRNVILDFKNAWCSRICHVLENGTVYCLMPPVLLGNEEFVKDVSDDESETIMEIKNREEF